MTSRRADETLERWRAAARRGDPHAILAFERLMLRIAGMDELTPRQLEVLQLTAEGMTAEQTAAALGIGLETVKTHRKDILYRLGARNVTHAVSIGMEHGLIA